MRVVVSADLPLDAQAYLLERDGAAFRTFMCEEMSLLEYDITQCWREGQATKIRLNSKPDVGAWIPGALAQKVPDKLEYFDEVTYCPDLLPATGPFELHIHSKAPFLGDKGKFESRVVIEALGPGHCRHTLEQTIEFKGLWGLGSVAKKLAKKSLEDSFADMPGIVAKWANIRQELLQTPHGRERLLAGRPRIEGVPWIDEHVACIKQGAHPHRGRGKPHRHKGGEQAVAVSAAAGAPAVQAVPSPPPAAGTEEAVPPSAFATAAGAEPAAPEPQELQQADRQRPGQGHAGGQAGVQPSGSDRVEQAAPAPSRQATGLTAFYTASEELPLPPSGQPLPPAEQAQQAQQAAPSSGAPPSAPKRGQVQVVRVAADGQPLPAVVEGSSAAGSRPPSSASYSADRSSSEDAEEDWATCAPWRAYYQAHGLAPLRSVHTLPPKLVERVFSGRRPRPVRAEALGSSSQAAALSGPAASRGLIRRLKTALARWFGRGRAH